MDEDKREWDEKEEDIEEEDVKEEDIEEEVEQQQEGEEEEGQQLEYVHLQEADDGALGRHDVIEPGHFKHENVKKEASDILEKDGGLSDDEDEGRKVESSSTTQNVTKCDQGSGALAACQSRLKAV